jgi:MFS family permease
MCVAAAFYFVWGWGYDRFNRKYLLIFAGFIWGATSLLIGISPTFATFSMSYIMSAVDNGSYSGIFSMVGDYFNPKNRGKVLGLLQSSQPIALLAGILVTNLISTDVNWRLVLLIAGLIAFIMMILVALGIEEPMRGESESAMQGIRVSGVYLPDTMSVKDLFKRRGFVSLFLIGLFAIIPWSAIVSWMGIYLQESHSLLTDDIYRILFPSLTALTLGYPLGGMLGDGVFKSSRRGRVIVSLSGVALSILFFAESFLLPTVDGTWFVLLMMFTGFSMALEKPNVLAMVFDITLPELRSTSMSIVMFFQLVGYVSGPLFVQLLIPFVGLGRALLWVCVGAWGISFVILMGVYQVIPKEIEWLRKQMAYRSQLERHLQMQDAD